MLFLYMLISNLFLLYMSIPYVLKRFVSLTLADLFHMFLFYMLIHIYVNTGVDSDF